RAASSARGLRGAQTRASAIPSRKGCISREIREPRAAERSRPRPRPAARPGFHRGTRSRGGRRNLPRACAPGRLAGLGGTVVLGSPADFGKVVVDDKEKWAKVI